MGAGAAETEPTNIFIHYCPIMQNYVFNKMQLERKGILELTRLWKKETNQVMFVYTLCTCSMTNTKCNH
jgi:hypothetical protein